MITILVGKSASGKDTLMNELLRKGFSPIISYTTRPIRENEEQDREYHFVSNELFDNLKKQGKFLETREYETIFNGIKNTWKYASPIVHPQNKDYVTILDVNGTNEYINKYGEENIEVFFLDVPLEIREERARKRGSFSKQEWDRRAISDDKEIDSKKINTGAFIIQNTTGEITPREMCNLVCGLIEAKIDLDKGDNYEFNR